LRFTAFLWLPVLGRIRSTCVMLGLKSCPFPAELSYKHLFWLFHCRLLLLSWADWIHTWTRKQTNNKTTKQPKKVMRGSKKPRRKGFLSLLFSQVCKSCAECPSGLTFCYKLHLHFLAGLAQNWLIACSLISQHSLADITVRGLVCST